MGLQLGGDEKEDAEARLMIEEHFREAKMQMELDNKLEEDDLQVCAPTDTIPKDKLRIVTLRFGTGRQKMVLERWTNPKRSRHTCSPRRALHSEVAALSVLNVNW